ncbi:MAG: vitamin K epoxide reductase [Chlamydiae bacterium CG10_big_fil_rev_8_21_14_0_10_42_34]|nr:MAG: vitamin K epoxide reductase [Chlamydiae bacterium CG10_big_fil_rev_8_21_14_0_10_42_34]
MASLPPSSPRPWDYNPSSWSQRLRIAAIAMIAVVIALYLGFYQWRLIPTVWDPIFGDGTKNVLDSEVSHQITGWIRLPDAILGVFAYVSDIVFALAGSERRWQDRPWLVILFGIDVIPLGIVSIILVVLQGIAVKFWCFLCLITALVSLILIVLAYDEVISSCIYLIEIKKRGSWKTLWLAFWGYPSLVALEAGEATLQKRKRKK